MVAAHDFDIQVGEERAAQIVTVRGEVDLATARRFAAGLRRVSGPSGSPVVVDLCEVSFIDSTGMQLLLNLLRRLTRQRRRLTVACAAPAVQRVFEITRLDGTFELYGSRAEALAALERPGGLRV